MTLVLVGKYVKVFLSKLLFCLYLDIALPHLLLKQNTCIVYEHFNKILTPYIILEYQTVMPSMQYDHITCRPQEGLHLIVLPSIVTPYMVSPVIVISDICTVKHELFDALDTCWCVSNSVCICQSESWAPM